MTRTWDAFFAGHIEAETHTQVYDTLTHYIRSLWGSGERGKYAVAEKATTRLIELSRDLGVVAFDALDLGRPVLQSNTDTQFGVCTVNTRFVNGFRDYEILAIKRKDNARFQDHFVPPSSAIIPPITPAILSLVMSTLRRDDATGGWE